MLGVTLRKTKILFRRQGKYSLSLDSLGSLYPRQTSLRFATILAYTLTFFFSPLGRAYKLCKRRDWLLPTVCPPILTCGIATDRSPSSISLLHQVMPWSQLPLCVTWVLLSLLPGMSCLLTGYGCVTGCPVSPRSDCPVCHPWYSKILDAKAITSSQIMQVMVCWLHQVAIFLFERVIRRHFASQERCKVHLHKRSSWPLKYEIF